MDSIGYSKFKCALGVVPIVRASQRGIVEQQLKLLLVNKRQHSNLVVESVMKPCKASKTWAQMIPKLNINYSKTRGI